MSLIDRKRSLRSDDLALRWIAVEVGCSRHVEGTGRGRIAGIANMSSQTDCTGDRVTANVINNEIGQLKHDGRSRAWPWSRSVCDQVAIHTPLSVRRAKQVLALCGGGVAATQQRQSEKYGRRSYTTVSCPSDLKGGIVRSITQPGNAGNKLPTTPRRDTFLMLRDTVCRHCL